jgi:hypothetical protein
VGPRAGLDRRKISPLLGFDPRTAQPVAIRDKECKKDKYDIELLPLT